MTGSWATRNDGSGIPVSRYARTPLLRMRQYHLYEKAVREERLLDRLNEINLKIARDFRNR